MFCPKCGKENRGGARRCESCGNPMPHQAPNDYLKWSVLALLFFFPFALVPIFIALSSRAARRHGDDVLADVRAASARRCFWVVIIIGTAVQVNYIVANWDELCAVYQQQRAILDERFGLVPADSGHAPKEDRVDQLLGDADNSADSADAPAADDAQNADRAADRAAEPDADVVETTALPARGADVDDRIAPKNFVDRLLENSVEIIVDVPAAAPADTPKETTYEL